MNKDSKRQGATMEEPEELTLQFLREITDGFSEKREVGKGGFGTVYKGVTKTGEDVAVKILRDGGKDLDYRQFRNEYYNLMKVKHANIVQFLGYCFEIEPIRREYNGRTVLAEKTHTALCFEFVHNGSLQKHLSDESCGLDWHTRYKIIKGTCEGLKYLHKDLGESLLHLDLKPDNILLDKNMVPKIADFGLSKIFCDGLIRTTQSPLGTLGYQPPEYIDRGKISEKFDIFSLGAIIIKIVSGPNGYSKYLGMPVEFIDQVQRNWRERWQACSNDFLYEAWFRQVETCTQIALNCLDDDSQKRPDIVEIIDMLNEIEIDNDEVLDFQAPKERTITVCEITMHNEMKPTKEHKVMTDHHQHSNLIISSRSSEIESDRTQGSLLDVGKELIVGREENKKTMASFLASMSENIIIFPVYGIGGIGKTTFARLIYNDANFKYYSQVWVYVSPGFDLFKIGNSIISQLSGKENHANEIQQIKSYLAKLISGKNILIVLDDLWENNTIRLVDLKDILSPGDSRKIIVLVTTRSQDIAKKICSNIEPYKIEALTDEMCWDIIKQKSGFDARHDNKKLVDIGKDIARKCGGVALAAQTLGSMLQSMKYDEWMKVKDSDIWNETISRDASLPNHVLASLKLSYVSMDDYLKSCFTYCAIFPKGHMIVKDDLFYQWISLGFIKPTLLFSTLQLCDKYIMRLLGMTFLQHSVSPTSYQAYGEHGTVFTMHDLVHDLAISLLDDQILDQRKQVNTGVSCCRYALLTDCSKPLESCMTSPAKLTALHFLDCWVTELHAAAFELYESLRVLDLSHCLIHKLPDSIGRLKQLRYLNAPRIRDRMVPECITKLSKLRYISLRGSCSILALPESIGEMEGLVHLDLSGCLRIEKLPESFGNLRSLEHLDFAGCKNATGVSQCLARLTKLQHLNLSNCKNIGDLPRALGSLTELQYLNLSDSSYISGYKLAEADFLCFLTKLKYLNLSSSSFHMNLSSGKERRIISSPEVLGSLTELKYLNLSHHYIWGKLPESFGNLCNLVHLDLSYCHPLQGLSAALNGITKLQFLDLYQCSGFDTMEGLQDALGNLSELRHLNLGCCIGRISYYHPDRIDGLLGCICTLTNLEYLSLRENNTIYCIPETIAKLRKLHTLDLSSCGSLQRLPATIYEIKSLKYIYTTECWKLDRSILPHYTSTSRIPPLFVGYTGGGESSSYLFQIEARNPARLKISRLENVKSAKEAYTIKLVQMTEITQLELEWTRGAKRFVDDEEVLRELEAPYGVSEFRLQGYNSASFPSWVMHCDAYLPDLTRIDMWNLPSCNNLPPLGQLPNLKLLNIRRLDRIKKIDADLYGGTTAFPRLEEFCIDDMEWLEVWNTAYSMFPCLRCVEIRDCPRLSFEAEGPEPRMSSSWSNAQLSCCRGEASLSRDLNVEECCVVNCSDLACSSPDFLRGLTSLEILTVENCESFTSLPSLGNLVSLTELHIGNCKNIWTLPDSIQELFGLKRLVIIECPELNLWCQYNETKIVHVRHRVRALAMSHPILKAKPGASHMCTKISLYI